MRRPQPLGLLEETCLGRKTFGRLANRPAAMAHHDGDLTSAGLFHRAHHMGQHRQPAIGCSTLGSALFMRVPSPAASTIDRQLLMLMFKVRKMRVDRQAATLYHARSPDQIRPPEGIPVCPHPLRPHPAGDPRHDRHAALLLLQPHLRARRGRRGRALHPRPDPLGAVALALLPFIVLEWATVVRALLAGSLRRLLLLAFLGMWICGAIVYLALGLTSATNGTLIYTTSPVIIILLEAIFFGRRIGWREGAGALIAFAGVATIVLGAIRSPSCRSIQLGDLLFVGAAVSWATYSILYRSGPLRAVSNMTLFAIVAGRGALLLAPIAVSEWALGAVLPTPRPPGAA
jgi:hypothetical protein